jgi:hypothetical protein
LFVLRPPNLDDQSAALEDQVPNNRPELPEFFKVKNLMDLH